MTTYTTDLQKLFLEMMIDNPASFVRVQNIFNPQNFDRALREPAEFIFEHATRYKTMPTVEQINATFGSSFNSTKGLDSGHHDWFLTEFESFCKRQELERAILKCADLLEKGDYDPVEKIIKDAVQIGLIKDIGTDYFYDPRSRLEAIWDNKNLVKTGWPSLDYVLFGGFAVGELNVFAGQSGSGKSLFLMNLAVNWFTAGMNGAYITLELSENLCAQRIDAMVTNMGTRGMSKKLDDIELKVKMTAKKSGSFQIKYMPAQSNVNDIRSYVKELEIRTGKKLHFLVVDYLDLIMPISVKVNPSDLFVKDKYVSEELRNLAQELKVVFLTASQLNRSSIDEVEFDHSHISGGISKINSSDNVFGIFTTRAMRERGKYQIQLLKTRNSTGVGKKVELDYDIESMRITDSGDGTSETPVNDTSSLINKIKNKSSLVLTESVDKTTGEITKLPAPTDQKSILDSMLSSLNTKK